MLTEASQLALDATLSLLLQESCTACLLCYLLAVPCARCTASLLYCLFAVPPEPLGLMPV